jgi:peptidyl-tRNA hydrolase, PTH1 family
MVADVLADRWHLGRPRARFRGLIAEGRVEGSPPGSALSGSSTLEPPPSGSGLSEVGLSGSELSGVSRTEGPPPRAYARVAVLWPQTYMNDAGRSVGPARGAFKLPLERVLVVHDEIDIPFGEVRPRVGGGLAGHNGLKSIKRELGGADFVRVRIGVGRPPSSDPEIVSSYVLGRFREDPEQVHDLIERAADRIQAIVLGEDPA